MASTFVTGRSGEISGERRGTEAALESLSSPEKGGVRKKPAEAAGPNRSTASDRFPCPRVKENRPAYHRHGAAAAQQWDFHRVCLGRRGHRDTRTVEVNTAAGEGS